MVMMMMMILKKRLGVSVMYFCFRLGGLVVLICPLHLLPEFMFAAHSVRK